MVLKLAQLLFLSLFFLSPKVLAHADAPVTDELFSAPRYLAATISAYDYHLTLLDLRARDVEILGVDYKRAKIDVYLNQNEFLLLKQAGFRIELDDSKSILMLPDQAYKTPAEIESYLQDIHARYPDLTELKEIGRSLENRPIYALKLAVKNGQTNDIRPAILFNSMHHAREVMTPEVAIDIIDYLLQNYASDSKVEHWLTDFQIWVVPMLNVDGNNKVWSGDSMWRKNMRGGYGVDINRNYPYKWGSCNGSSGSRWSDTYRGESGGSEPETKTLMSLVSQLKPVFNISFHSYSEMVLYPYGCQGQKTPQHTLIATLGEQMAKSIGYIYGTPWEILYGVDGGDVDWMFATHQVIPYVIEVNSSSQGFQPSYSQWRDKTVLKVRPAWMRLLNRMDESAISGTIELTADQSLQEIDVVLKSLKGGEFAHRVKDNGQFFIPAVAGEYMLEIRKQANVLRTLPVTIGESRVQVEIKI